MEGTYGVYFGAQLAGKVTVRRTGLYYRFCCHCRLKEDAIYRLRILCGDRQENLGILVPTGDGFSLDTRIPCKRLGEGEPSFLLAPKHDKTEGTFVPVYPEEPFAYISRLKEAYLVRKDRQVGVLLKQNRGA